MCARVVSAETQLNKLDDAIEIYHFIESAWQQQKGIQEATLLVKWRPMCERG